MNAPKQGHEGHLANDYGDPPERVHETGLSRAKNDSLSLVEGSDASSDYVTSGTSAKTIPQTVGKKAINECRISLVPFAGSDNDYVGLTAHSVSNLMANMLP